MEKINEYQKRFGTVRKLMDEDKQAHFEKVKATNEKYAKTRLEITSKIKVLSKIITLLCLYK